MLFKKNKNGMDMLTGSIAPKIIAFAIPLILSGMLQLMFNAADVMVVGQFVGPTALAAVGSTGSLTNLLVNLAMGLSVGANVVVANDLGRRDENSVYESTHTAMLLSVILGIIMIFLGLFLSRPLLELMGSPENVIDQSVLYMRIFFLGMPLNMMYNFGAAILRTVGDTQRPMIYLTIAGVVNVVFNLVFVIIFKMGVAGVALATVISQGISAFLVVLSLMHYEGLIRIHLKELKLHKQSLVRIFKIGIPAGVQGMMFSISNVMIQSAINSFGDLAMAGCSVEGNLEGFLWTVDNSMNQAAVSFVGQNYGAENYHRIRQIRWRCLGIVASILGVMSVIVYVSGPVLFQLYTSDPAVIEYAMRKLALMMPFMFLGGCMNSMAGVIRGMGRSISPMVLTLLFTCVFRVVWIGIVFAQNPNFDLIFISYPVTWAMTFASLMISFFFIIRKYPNQDAVTEPLEKTA